MSIDSNHVKISMGVWSVVSHPSQSNQRLSGKAYGLKLESGDNDFEGEDFLSVEEALELRDYITEHFGGSND